MCLTACNGGSDVPAAAVTTTAAPTTIATTTSIATPAPSTTTSTTLPAVDPDCVVTVESGDSVGLIATDAGLTIADVLAENRLGESTVIHPGDELDVCIGNEFDDVTGTSRKPPSPAEVRRQQIRLNELFTGYSMPELLVDGISGPMTR